MSHYQILAIVLLLSGIFGGLVNFLLNQDSDGIPVHFWKSITTGVAASIMVPLFLHMISSNLMESSEKEPLDYFQIAGFCLIAAIFSRRFIEGMWEKLLQQLKKTEDKVEKTSQVVEEEKEKVATLIGLQEEPDDLESDRNLKLTLTDYEVMGLDEMQPFLKKDMMTIMDALDDPNYRFRTVRGIATATKLDRDLVSGLLEALADKAIGAVKKIRKDDKDLWVLTEKGRKGLQEFKKE